MDIITPDDFKNAKKLPEFRNHNFKELTDQEFNKLLEDMQTPVEAQKKLAVQIKSFLDSRIQQELKEKGILSDHTRRWVETFNTILEKIQKALYGDKSVSLHLHKVSHSQIAAKMRKVIENDE